MTKIDKISRWTGKLPVVVGVLLAGLAGATGVVPRLRQRDSLDRMQAEVDAPRLVRTAKLGPGPAQIEMTLPATTAPFQSTALYAKSVGFLRRNLVDVGDAVKAGQLLAEIDAPETDEDLRLAQARLQEAQANVGIVQRNATRNTDLAGVGVVSEQQADDTRALANSAVASLRTRQAELQRLNTMRGYQRVLAPFDGIVTRRGVDRGALVGPAAGGGLALFEVAQIDQLRVFVDVPQSLSRGVRPGVEVAVFAPDAPTRVVKGKVARTSGVLDPSTRTMHTEVHIPGDGALLGGAFVYVRFSVPRPVPAIVVPASALIVRKEGTLLAVVREGRVHLAPIQIGRDLGKELELASGAAVGDVVVINPPDQLGEGMPVRIKEETRGPAR